MNDSINMTWLRIKDKLSILQSELQNDIISDIRGLIELEQKAIKNLQLIEVLAFQLKKGDIIFDPSKKTLHRISFCEYRKNCQFNIPHENKEVLVHYKDDEPCDYYDHLAVLYILVDIGEIANIQVRPDPIWEEE